MTDYLSTGNLPDDYEQLAKTVRDFAQSVVAPVVRQTRCRTQLPVRGRVAGWRDMGLFGLPFPEEYGGMGGDYFALCLALEELGKVDQSVAITLEAGVSLGAMPVYRFGNEAQKQDWLPLLTSGKALGAFGLTEAGGGSDAGATRTTAQLDDGSAGLSTAPSSSSPTPAPTSPAGHRHRGHGRPRRQQGDLLDPGPGAHAGLHRRTRLQQGRLERLGHPPADASTTCGCPRRTCSASVAAATRTSCASSTRAASRSPRCRSAPRRAVSTRASSTPRSARRSASPSAVTRRSSSSSRAWRPARTRRAPPTTTPPH